MRFIHFSGHNIFQGGVNLCQFSSFFKKQIARLVEFNNAPVTIMKTLFVIA